MRAVVLDRMRAGYMERNQRLQQLVLDLEFRPEDVGDMDLLNCVGEATGVQPLLYGPQAPLALPGGLAEEELIVDAGIAVL